MDRDARAQRLARHRLISWLGFAGLVFACACAPTNPPPQYPPPQFAPAQPAEPPTGEAPPMQPEALPIDPDKPMPEASLSTNAILQAGVAASVMVDGRADIYSAGMKAPDGERAGKLPADLTLAAGSGTISFTKIVGKAGCVASAAHGPDGGDCAGGTTRLTAAGTYSGIDASDRTLFLVGVFVAAKPPAKAPATLDFSPDKQGVAFKELSPALGQVFFIGDGLTGTGSGDVQTFKIPAGAVHLYLGYADGFGFMGVPGAYGDNTGGLSVSAVQKTQ